MLIAELTKEHNAQNDLYWSWSGRRP
jgi:hypothetical protein